MYYIFFIHFSAEGRVGCFYSLAIVNSAAMNIGVHIFFQIMVFSRYEGEGEVAQSCPTLCDPVDCNLLGFSIHGILQARILEWIAISSPGDLPDPGIKPRSPALGADALTSEPPGTIATDK